MLGNSNMGEQFVQNYVNYVNQNILISLIYLQKLILIGGHEYRRPGYAEIRKKAL